MISIRSYIGRHMQRYGLHDATGEQLDVRRWERMEMMRFWGMERDLGMGTRSGWMRVIQRQRMRVSMRGGGDMQHLFVEPDAETQEEPAVPAPRRRGRPRRSRGGGGGGLGALFVERTGVSQVVEGQVGSKFFSQSTRSQLRGRPGGSSRGGAVGASQEGAGGRERGRGRGRGQGRGKGGRRGKGRGRGSP
ncbi:hypothetical protein O6H91_05G100700 [Diphasiastrum complanatum]|uniref:Uncharacterized protein n=1 Tax=Diphasiastrum complanatum TaxID=34168 RepID=A0ACC2DRL6_DIPCM|nr:hypothetical protein O6H91_05G100700 [Diphasiastrum complanatum]